MNAKGLHYLHKQQVPIGLFAIIVGLACLPAVFTQQYGNLAIVAFLALFYWFGFSQLTIFLDDDSLSWVFGLGLIRKSVKLKDIASCLVVRNRPLNGWGIHCFGKGWLYNVYGLMAVEITLVSGACMRLGTDEPERLKLALEERLSRRQK